MPGKFDKFKEIFGMVEPLAKPFVPGAAGSILDKVNGVLNNSATPVHPATVEALQTLAAHVDEYNNEQDQAILAMNERLKKAGI